MKNTASTPKTLVIGAGSWGTALAAIATLQSDTLLLCRDLMQAQIIQEKAYNPRYLSQYSLPSTLKATHDIRQAIDHLGDGRNALIILGVPVLAMRSIGKEWFDLLSSRNLHTIPILWTCKGFEQSTGLLPHEVMAQVSPFPHQGVLSGPSFAQEVIQGLPVALTVASQHPLVKTQTTSILHHGVCRIYQSDDVIGVEVGGALKNIVAIACGIADGLALGANARAALITRGLAEIQRLGIALGGQAHTFSGLTGLGDLILTATGDLSRNRQVGLAIAKGLSLHEILASGMTAEGVRSAKDTLNRAQAMRIDMPITQTICQVLFEGLSPRQAVQDLLERQATHEHLSTFI